MRSCRRVPPYEANERSLDVGAAAKDRGGLSRGVRFPLSISPPHRSRSFLTRSDYDVKFIKLGKPDLCSTRAGSETGTGGGSKHADEATVDGNEPGEKGDDEGDTLAVPVVDSK